MVFFWLDKYYNGLLELLIYVFYYRDIFEIEYLNDNKLSLRYVVGRFFILVVLWRFGGLDVGMKFDIFVIFDIWICVRLDRFENMVVLRGRNKIYL